MDDDGLLGISCHTCETTLDAGVGTVTCPDCVGPLRLDVEADALPATPADLGSPDRSGVDRFASLFGTGFESADPLGAGGTVPIDCPSIATDAGLATVRILNEGRNPTGSSVDRELAFAIRAAVAADADRVVLPSTGPAARSAAAYAGRAGVDSLSFVPSRTTFLEKAMTNVHGGDLSVVEGRYADARAAYEARDADGFPVDPRSPARRLGAVTLAWDLVVEREPMADAIVLPVAHGHRIAGIETGLRAASEAGLIDDVPALYAAQPAGCAPIVRAVDGDGVEPVASPDSIVGTLEVPDPVLAPFAIEALAATDGGAVAVPDEDALAAAVDANATAGVECSATGGVALAGLTKLCERGKIEPDASVLVVDPLAAAPESDVLRSHLMSRGV